MKKKSILAMLLAVSMFAGGASLTGCKIIGGNNGDTNQTETISVTGVTLNAKTLEIEVNGSEQLVANVAPKTATNKSCKWESSDPSVVSVSASGKITGKSVGVATITVTTDDGGKTDVCEVTVRTAKTDNDKVSVTGVTVDPTSLKLTVGESKSVTAKVAPSDATNKNVSWVSDDPETVSVDGGTVTAIKAGTAKITVTTEDGGKTAVCTVTVSEASSGKDPNEGKDPDEKDPNEETNPTVTKYDVTFLDGGVTVSTAQVEKGKKAQAYTLTKDGYILEGWTTNSSGNGQLYNFDTPVNGTLTLYAVWTEIADESIYSYAGYECAAFEWDDSNPAKAKVEYKINGGASYTALDSNLVRAAETAGKARADVVGLKKNTNYDFKITGSDGKVYTVNNMLIAAYDRSGYAHFKKSDGVGAYKDDGTPKDNAQIYYVTESNKNNVGGTGKSVVELLQSQNGSQPMIIRIIGTVGAATWNKIDYNADKKYNAKNKIPTSEVKGKNGKLLSACKVTQSKYLNQQDLIDGGFNTLNYTPNDSFYNGGRCEVLNGLNSRAIIDGSEYDSCWNDASIQNAQNVTVEGIGEDARIFQWGMTFKTSNSIEVRNITFTDYTEDACSFEGDSSKTSASQMTSKYVWVHNNTFNVGKNYWDVCGEQDKHEGDGGTDFKGVANITLSYNRYNQTHKTGLIGGGSTHMTANVTFHHNYYNGCTSRLPLSRQANMHMYNNYYSGTTSTDISVRSNGYAFVENCYFEAASKDTKHIELQYENDNGTVRYGAAKLVGCVIDQSGAHITVNSNINKDNSLYIGNDRQATVVNQCAFGQNFDTNSSLFYYENGQSKVENMLTAQEVKTKIPELAGVQKRGKSVGTGGNTSTTTPSDPVTPGVSKTYTYSYDKLSGVSSLADNVALSQANFTGDNAFLIIGEGVTYRGGTGAKTTCIQTINDGISVEFKGTGTITIEFSSTGGENESRLGLKASNGSFLTASNVGTGISAVSSGDEAGCYKMVGTSHVTITFTVTKAGIYTIYCPNATTMRGARIYSVVMTDNT